jgi:hypothetical protein
MMLAPTTAGMAQADRTSTPSRDSTTLGDAVGCQRSRRRPVTYPQEAKSAELPVQQPIIFEPIIRHARPQPLSAILVRADEGDMRPRVDAMAREAEASRSVRSGSATR